MDIYEKAYRISVVLLVITLIIVSIILIGNYCG